jgi:hypothetical protein
MDDQENLRTQPTATAIMERIQAFETRLAQDLDTLGARMESQFAQMGSQILSLREEMETRFSNLTAKIEVLYEDTMNVRASQREILKRFSELEQRVKAS